ncbi:hypothetical protein NCC49_002131 [Naganishia albida]|nr:hypothetical protein NCC49_002131 [Naganishia albida]
MRPANPKASADPPSNANVDPSDLLDNSVNKRLSISANASPDDSVPVTPGSSPGATFIKPSGTSDVTIDAELGNLVAEAAKRSADIHAQLVKAAYEKGHHSAVIEANRRYESSVSNLTREAHSSGYAQGVFEQKKHETIAVNVALQEGEDKRRDLQAKVELLQERLRSVGTARLALETVLREKQAREHDLLASQHRQPKKPRAPLPSRRKASPQNDLALRALAKALRKSNRRSRGLTRRLTARQQHDQRLQALTEQLATAQRELERFEAELSATRYAEGEQRRQAEQCGADLLRTAAQLAEQRALNE